MKAGNAEIWIEVCSWHLRVRSYGWFRDDAQWESKEGGQTVPLKELIAWCQAFATGEDTSVTDEVFGRSYTRTFSLQDYDLSGDRVVWFHPMDGNRLVFSVAIVPSLDALMTLLIWAKQHRDVVEPGAHEAIVDGIGRCFALLDQAHSRWLRAERG